MGPPRKPTPKHAAAAKAIVDDACIGTDKRRRSNPKTRPRPKSSPRTSDVLLTGDDTPATEIATSPPLEKATGPPKRTSATVSAYVVTTSVLWKEKEIFPRVMAGHKFVFKTFNSLVIRKVAEKASKKGYAIIQQSALATISVGGNTKAMVGQCIDSTDWRIRPVYQRDSPISHPTSHPDMPIICSR